MHELDLAYMAGAFDGDGSISLIRRLGKNGKNNEYYALAQIEKVNSALPKFFHEVFGGQIIISKPNVGKDGISRMGTYQWKSPKGEKCKEILLKLLPYLCQKREQANLLIDYITENPFIRGHRLTQEEMNKRDDAFNKLGILKLKNTTGKKISIKPKRNNTDPYFLSYLAGLMDTDGSFSIKREKPSRKSKSPSHTPVILLSMVAIPSLNFIKDNCIEGRIIIIKAKNARFYQSYRFGIYSKTEAISFLEKVIPYLKIKKAAAECLLEFCKNSVRTAYGKGGLSESELEFRENCYMRLKELNDGVYKSPLIILKTLPDNAGGNKGQAGDEPCSSNAVSEENPKGYAVL
jgi:hypothetical protein